MKVKGKGLWRLGGKRKGRRLIVKFEFGKYGYHPAKLEESMEFGVLVHFYLYFTILMLPEC